MANHRYRIRFGASDMHVIDGAFSQSGLHEAFGLVFTILMAVAAESDVRARRISNGLVVAILLLGVAFVIVSMGPQRGMISALEGALVGLAIWAPIWAFKRLGAGDVKLFAASSVWIGPALALKASLLSAAIGGVLALSWLVVRAWSSREDKLLGHRAQLAAVEHVDVENVGVGEPNEMTTLPYGVAMAAGLTLTAWFPHLL